FGHEAGKVGFRSDIIMGQGSYAPGGRYEKQAVFYPPANYWVALKAAGKERGIKIDLLPIALQKPTSQFKEEVRKEALATVADWVEINGGWSPKFTDFGWEKGKIPISYNRLTGTGKYALGKKNSDTAIFNGRKEFDDALAAELERRRALPKSNGN